MTGVPDRGSDESWGISSQLHWGKNMTSKSCWLKNVIKHFFVMTGQVIFSLVHYLLRPFHWLVALVQRLFMTTPWLCSQVHNCCECAIKQAYIFTAFCLKAGLMALVMLLFMMFSTGTVWYLTVKTYVQPVHYTDDNRITCSPGNVESMANVLIDNYTRGHPAFLQPSNYFWVKSNSSYNLPFGTKGIEDLLLSILSITANYNLPPEMRSQHCKTCVVVGNGNRLRNSSLGHRINKYDIVIRLNNAPVHQYQNDVGNKTTMRLFYPESADFDPSLENNPDTLLVLVPFKALDLQWLKSILNNEKRPVKGFWKKPPILLDVKPGNLRILNPYFMEVTAGKLLNVSMKPSKKAIQKPTTGLLAITFALHFCDVVHIAGFGYPELTNKKQPIHYYEKATLKSMEVSEHNISHETLTIKRLLDVGIIKNLTRF